MVRRVAPVIFVFVFMLIVVSVMLTVVFSLIGGMSDFDMPWIFILPVLVFIFIIFAIIYAVFVGIRSIRRTNGAQNTLYSKPHPMNYERNVVLNYCRFCGANLGTSDPDFCPECRSKLKDDFYH